MKKLLLITFLLLTFGSQELLAQGVTTASIRGTVVDSDGNGLPGATVIARHEPTGTVYGTSTRADGRYNLPNLRIGGPYTVKATYIGFEEQMYEEVNLLLGQVLDLKFELAEDITTLGEIVISGNNETFNSDRTGSAIAFDNSEIRKLPTITRSASDIYRLTPSSDGNSFAGRNDQYNNFSLDGSIFNNPFGLDAATPGGQTDAQPISLDAIAQIQVSTAPFDVTQAGFTGASVNAVTKSGTNNLSGTVFGFFRNDALLGSQINGQDVIEADLTQIQTGFSIGGPIVKDKLFFFANMELERREDLGSSFIANNADGTTAINESRVEAADLMAVSDVLQQRFGYETGPYEGFIHDTDNQKGIIKIDWNINQNHTLTATYNFLDALKQKPAHPTAIGRRGPDATTLQFRNSGYQINNKIHSGLIELKSIFGNKFSNKLQVGYTKFDDSRDPFSEPFPVINIYKDGIPYIIAGHEPFSIHNRLEQDVLQFTNNFEIYAGDHTITVGTSFEKFSFDNSFNLFSYGFGVFGSFDMNTFVADVQGGALDGDVAAARQAFIDNNANDGWALAETNVGQWAFYLQDRWSATENLTLTGGLRIDIPMYFDTGDNIIANTDPITYYDADGNQVTIDNTKLPDGNVLFSPRLGFNWDVSGDKTMQVRGGTGLFSGRLPFVWIGNQVANPFTGFLNVTDPDFKFPQVWRTSIGVDKSFGEGWLGTFDFLYTKDINAMMVRDYSLISPSTSYPGVDNRPVYQFPQDVVTYEDPFTGTTAARNYVFTNADKGRSINLTFELKRNWSNGLYTSLAYNYLDAKSVSSIESEISSDAFALNPTVGQPNRAVLAPSIYGNKHRIVGNTNKTIDYGPWSTTLSLFFEYAQGGRYSYTYSGDLNGDGSGLNDLLYIPTDSELDQMNFNTAAEREAYRDFIAQDDYLSENRGSYAERYDALSPWYSRFDFRLLQNYELNNGHSIEFSIDILNIGNLISSEWGVRELPTNVQPVGILTNPDGSLVLGTDNAPTYTFDPNLNNTFTANTGLQSRWQMQFGLRYSF